MMWHEMIWPQLETVAQIAVGRLLNSLPEGVLIAGFAWLTLRLLPRQNSGTRFAVWFVALLAVVGLPVAGVHFLGGTGASAVWPVGNGGRSLITVPVQWGLLLFLGWIVAACAALLRLTAGLWQLRRLRRSCTPIDAAALEAPIRRTVADFSSRFSSPFSSSFFSPRPVILATSEDVSVPSALGFFAPMIVIPSWALRELSPEELNVVLLHELAHLRRWDDWTNLLQKIARAVLVFHPAVWWIESRLSLEREMACDDAVLAETSNPRGYAQCLVGLLEKSFARRGWAMAQAAVHRASEASLRLAQILDKDRANSKCVWKPALGLVGAFSLACLMVVPRAPRLVAFETRARAIPSDNAHAMAVALSPADLPAATVIPAARRASLSTGTSAAIRNSRPASTVVVARAIERFEHVEDQAVGQKADAHPDVRPDVHPGLHLDDAPQVIAARVSSDNELGSADQTAGEHESIPEPTLLVVHTAQRVGQNSWVWSVTVWRIRWVNPAQDAARAAVAKKT
jgi:beta-lactamase regulating signal transducer with metallopeptidase domain